MDGVLTRIYNAIAIVFVLLVLTGLVYEASQGFWGTNNTASVKASTGIEHGTIQVAARGLAFPDGTRTVAVGTSVVWTNYDGATHTVTARDQSFDSGNLTEHKTYTKKFTAIGVYHYYCKIHSFMTGTITVVRPYGT